MSAADRTEGLTSSAELAARIGDGLRVTVVEGPDRVARSNPLDRARPPGAPKD